MRSRWMSSTLLLASIPFFTTSSRHWHACNDTSNYASVLSGWRPSVESEDHDGSPSRG
jgi:hypothetical protein